MPKTAKNIWPRVLAWDNLVQAAREASRYKRYYFDVMLFNANLEENLIDIRERLASGQWRPGHFREFEVYEPKRRLVHAPPFADRVVHHALVQQIGPYFEARFIPQSFACRRGKGTLAASLHLGKLLFSAKDCFAKPYALKADIAKYFVNIDHQILLEVIARTIGDPHVLDLIYSLVNYCECAPDGKGLPLGALTSQLFANCYLDQLDHFVKENLRIRHYVRYMDDFIILDGDKRKLWQTLSIIRDFLDARLRLELNRKTGIFPVSQGVDFVGYRHWTHKVLPRKRNMKRARQQFKKLVELYARGEIDFEYVRPRVASFCGYMKHCDGYRSCESVLNTLVLSRSPRVVE